MYYQEEHFPRLNLASNHVLSTVAFPQDGLASPLTTILQQTHYMFVETNSLFFLVWPWLNPWQMKIHIV